MSTVTGEPGEAWAQEPGGSADSAYCSWCGGPVADGGHATCRHRLATVDPPRYCAACARRMVVQVDPVGWTARCSRHGERSSLDARTDR